MVDVSCDASGTDLREKKVLEQSIMTLDGVWRSTTDSLLQRCRRKSGCSTAVESSAAAQLVEAVERKRDAELAASRAMEADQDAAREQSIFPNAAMSTSICAEQRSSGRGKVEQIHASIAKRWRSAEGGQRLEGLARRGCNVKP
jgi:hypothetical protein